jgi:hypothetical protein
MDLSHLHELFPDADFGFSMKMAKGDASVFFQPSSAGEEILVERKRWLSTTADDYAGVRANGEHLVKSAWTLAEQWSLGNTSTRLREIGPDANVIQLGCQWEPDFLLLAPDDHGRLILQAGCVCFPSGWSLNEKLGQPLEAIHDVVPGLNPMIGSRIQTFLERLKPGTGWRRSNWGISSSPERNQHSGRRINRLNSDTPPESTWVRIEHQMLTRLPDCDGILFGIRLENVDMLEFQRDTVLRTGLHRALKTMPDAMARYKNLQLVRPALMSFLNNPSET